MQYVLWLLLSSYSVAGFRKHCTLWPSRLSIKEGRWIKYVNFKRKDFRQRLMSKMVML